MKIYYFVSLALSSVNTLRFETGEYHETNLEFRLFSVLLSILWIKIDIFK